jgi:hypothetical protein
VNREGKRSSIPAKVETAVEILDEGNVLESIATGADSRILTRCGVTRENDEMMGLGNDG